MLFAVHPIHTEAVANIKGRDEIITLLGSLAALYFSIRAYREKNLGLNFAAAGLFLLALFSKENAITFCAIVALTYYVFTKADFGKIVLKALTIRGIYGRQMYDTWYKMLALLDSGLNVDGMITHRFPASEYQSAFDLMATGEAGKVILDWTGV